MTPDEILNSPEYLYASIIKYLHRYQRRPNEGDLEKAKLCIEKLIKHEIESDDIVEIDMLTELDDCLLGAVYEADGTPVPVYDGVHARETLIADGMPEDEAIDYLSKLSEGSKIIWVDDIELGRPKKSGLRLCH